MGKEPAGLRRWRLAHKKKRRVRRVKTVRYVARRRRGRKGHGRKGSKAFPILLALPIIPGANKVWANRGAGAQEAMRQGVYEMTGVDWKGESGGINMNKVYGTLGMAIIGIVGHKVATKTGINRTMKKLTLGYLQL